jgi:hypothetical protein
MILYAATLAAELRVQAHEGELKTVQFSGGGHSLITGGRDGVAWGWALPQTK